MTENELSAIIVDAAVEVHRELGGPGLLEDVYEEALEEELRLRATLVERQLPVPIVYKGRRLRKPLRLDMKVQNLVLVDNKAVTEWNPVFEAQMLTYLRLSGLKLGLVINFGERLVKDGIHRVVNGLAEDLEWNAKPPRRQDAKAQRRQGSRTVRRIPSQPPRQSSPCGKSTARSAGGGSDGAALPHIRKLFLNGR